MRLPYIKFLTILGLVIFCQVSFGQVYQLMPQYGYQAPRMKFDSTLQIPTVCGVPTLKSVQFASKSGAIAFDSCNNRFYTYNPKTLSWSQVSGGGGSTDTTSLSNRINLKLDSVKRRSDSVFAYRNGTEIYQFKDSIGTNPPPVGYYGSFIDTTTQTAAVINTAYPVKLGVTELSNGVSIVNNLSGNPTRITIANAGIYNIQFSLQLEKTGGSGNMTSDIWLRKNGVNVPNTTGKVVLTGSANASPIVAAWNYVINASSNDYFELMWATSNVNVEIVKNAAIAPHPLVPSAILTVTQQSGIMAGTGISPLDTANMLAPYLRKTDTTSLSLRIDQRVKYTDTASMLAPYLRETDTASLSSRINSKLTISDTSTLQRKQLPAYSFIANGTNAAANGTATYFEDTSGTYTGSIAWTGTTAPSGATNHSYRWTRIGKCVTLNVNLIYATNGGALTAVVFDLPSDAPTPAEPAGLTAASQNMYPVLVWNTTSANALVSNAARGFLRNNSGNNAYEFVINFTTSAVNSAYVTLNYWTN